MAALIQRRDKLIAGSGQRFRLRERGIVSTREGRRGDLVVEVKLVLPRLLDERSKELLRELAKLTPGR